MAIEKKLIPQGHRIRVLVIDDSVVIRRLVAHALEDDPKIEVVGVASNGLLGLARVDQLSPDVITLDMEMPEMGGLEMVRRLREARKEVRVVMLSTLTARGASATIDALSAGADDYVTKVASEGSLDRAVAMFGVDLIGKIKQFFIFEGDAVPPPRRAPTTPSPAITTAPLPSHGQNGLPLRITPQVVAIGVSTGGPNALAAIMNGFPASFWVPILIVQHMPPVFTQLLADRLQTLTDLVVREAAEGMPVEGGKVYVAPGDYHMRIVRKENKPFVALDQAPPENSCRPSVDVLFRSVAEAYGAAALGVVMTGMGSDGLRGAEQLRARGSRVIVQDEATSTVWGMPGAIVGAGLADAVIPLDKLVPEIVMRSSRRTVER